MTELAARPRWLGLSIGLGIYSALLALLPDASSRLALLAPALLGWIAWFILSGGPNRWIVCFLCAAFLLPPLPIAMGNSGPHPSLLLAALGLFAGLLRLVDWRIPTDALSRAVMVLFSLLTLSVAFAALYSGIPVALGSLARVLLFGISVYVFFYVTAGPGTANSAETFRSVRLLFLAGSVSALFACVDFYFQFPAPAGFGPQFVWLDSGVFRRAQGIFYEASTLGNFCAFFLVMVAVSLIRKDSPVPRPLLFAGAAIFAPALVLSFSRASLLNLAVAITTLLWLYRDRFRYRQIAVVFLLAVAAGSAAIHYLLPSFTQLYWTRLSTSATFLLSSTERVLSGRLSSWNALAGFLYDNPFHALLGIGYKTLPYSNFVGESVVGDNMYLTMLVETGIVGLVAFLALNIAILVTAYRAARRSDARASFFGAWVFCFWMGQMFQMLSGDLFTYWRVMPLYFWAMAVAVRAADEHPLSRSI